MQPQQVCRWHRTGRSLCHPAGPGRTGETNWTLTKSIKGPVLVSPVQDKDTLEQFQQRAMRMIQGLELGWSRGSPQWWPGLAKSHRTQSERWSCVSAQEKGIKARISFPREVVESPPLQIFKAQPLFQQGLAWMISRAASNPSPSGTLMHQRKWTLWMASFSWKWLEKYFVWNVPLFFRVSDGLHSVFAMKQQPVTYWVFCFPL